MPKRMLRNHGGSFTKTNDMAEAFKDADIVYPKSWAPFAAMEKRTDLYAEGDFDGIDKLRERTSCSECRAQRLGLHRRTYENNKRRKSSLPALPAS